MRGYLELVRPPNLFTAAGDVVAGYLLATAGLDPDPRALGPLIVASVALYAGGVVLNDYFDRDVDTVERPERPIPSGGVAPGSVLRFGLVLLFVGVLVTALLKPAATVVAVLLAGAILLYDAKGKRIEFVGSLNMGACRSLNLLLGAAAGAGDSLALAPAFAAAAIIGIYIAAVTILSTGEVWGGNRAVARGVFVAIAVCVTAVLWMAASGLLPQPAYIPFLVVFASATLTVVGRVVSTPSAENIRRAIKTCVLSLLLLDAALSAGAAGVEWGIAVALLIIPSILIARLFAVT